MQSRKCWSKPTGSRRTSASHSIKLVEVDVDTKAYDAGHIPGAVGFNWQTQLQDQLRRDIISKEAFEALVGRRRYFAGRHGGPLRRQQQLVRRLRLLAVQDLRASRRAPDERRPGQVAERKGQDRW